MSDELVLAPDAIPSVQPVSTEQMMLTALRHDKVDALERLIALKRDEDERNAARDFNIAMVRCQNALEPVRKTALNKEIGKWHVALEELHRKSLPVIRAHGFVLSFGTDDSPLPRHVRTVCDCLHESGYSRRYRIDLAVDDKGQKGGASKTEIHGELSAMTQGQKRLTLSIFNIPIAGEGMPEPDASEAVTKEQAADLRAMLSEYCPASRTVDEHTSRFCAAMGVDSLESLPASRMAAAVQKIKQAGAAK